MLWVQYLELREFEYDVRAFVDFYTVRPGAFLSLQIQPRLHDLDVHDARAWKAMVFSSYPLM